MNKLEKIKNKLKSMSKECDSHYSCCCCDNHYKCKNIYIKPAALLKSIIALEEMISNE